MGDQIVANADTASDYDEDEPSFFQNVDLLQEHGIVSTSKLGGH